MNSRWSRICGGFKSHKFVYFPIRKWLFGCLGLTDRFGRLFWGKKAVEKKPRREEQQRFFIKKETLLLEGEPSVDSRLLRGGYTPLPGGSHPLLPEYYGCYTPISGRFRRDPRLQVFFSFEEMPVPLVEMKILMWSHGIWPIPEKKDKNNKVSVVTPKKNRRPWRRTF